MSFLSFLAEKGLFRQEDVSEVAAEAKRLSGGIDEMLAKGGVTAAQLLALKGEYYAIPPRDLSGYTVPNDVLRFVPETSARHYQVAPLGIVNGVLEIGIVDPDMIEARDVVQFIANKQGMPYQLFLISPDGFHEILEQYKNLSGEVRKVLSELDTGDIVLERSNAAPMEGSESTQGSEKEGKIVEDAPVTKIVAVILRHAVEGNASDVHIEHVGTEVRVRFRVDGVMYPSLILPAAIHNAVLARIKILAQMRLDEKRKPQDGRFSAHMDGKKVDFRVSTFPAYYGEKVVLRILDSSQGIRTLEAMGFSPEQMKIVRDAIARPYGLILLVGPTGSGKSTTLYSMLNELDRETRNVVSLEDPIEYNIPGVNQSQVRAEIGYTFANGLRSILRQDPDIIMVGEMRDKETAQLAIQAALTGHLVFSTLHTNNASGVIPRLIDMEVDPYLIAPTLILAVGQRLLRTLGPDGGKSVPMSESARAMIERQFADLPDVVRKTLKIPDHVYEPLPSPTCPSGTRGRVGVFEMLVMDRDIEHVILTNPSEQAVYDTARAKGMLTMKDDALRKAFAGVIPFVEVNNII
ncbi:MAG: ATPase, T2SS/T4P/T4SS family [bacterium]|nr:ATPase, T2SS/T4P/T4SS family [bacterium]